MLQKKIKEYKEFFDKNNYVVLKNYFNSKTKKLLKNYLKYSINLRIRQFIGLNNFSPTLGNFYKAWILSKKINYDRRSLLNYSISSEFYNIIKNKQFLELAKILLNTNEIYLSPVSNLRYKSSELPWAISKKHRDQDYWEKTEKKNKKMHFLTFWLPLTKIDKNTGCLSIYTNSKKLNFSLNFGDLIVFNPYVLHDASRSKKRKITCSFDIRFESKQFMTKDTTYFNTCISSKNKNKIISRNKFILKKPKKMPKLNHIDINSKTPSGLKY